MKVWELKKINEASVNFDFELDYGKLLKMSQEDIQLLVEEIENENIYGLYQFLEYIMDFDWKDHFSHLKGIEKMNLKEYIFNQIKNASSKEDANAIFVYYDFANGVLLSMFETVEEWKAYVESIDSRMEEVDNLLPSNLEIALKCSKENRCDLIKKIMKYSLSCVYRLTDWSRYSIDYDAMKISFSELIDLYQKGYKPNDVICLLNLWVEKSSGTIPDEHKKVDDSFRTVIDYLNESEMMVDEGLDRFRRVLSRNDVDNYPKIIEILKKVEEKGNLSDSFYQLLDLGIIENNMESQDNIERIIIALSSAEDSYQDSVGMARFIKTLPNVEIIKDMYLKEENAPVFKMICERFSTLIQEEKPDTEQVEYYANLLSLLTRSSSDVCSKVMNIMSLDCVKNMELEDREKLQNILLNPENFGSLDYIFTEYQKCAELQNKQSQCQELEPKKVVPEITSDTKENKVELKTVLELLEANLDFDKVLDRFGDDDEITPKTLIRSLAYKNN